MRLVPTRRNDLIRRAIASDADDLARVHVGSWRVAYRGILPDDYLDSLQVEPRVRWWRRFLEDGATVMVAEQDREVVGFCSVGISDRRGWGEVFAIYVDPMKWNQGHGRRLIEAGEGSLRDQGFSKALLWVVESNVRARDFYERCGWILGKPFRVEEIGGIQVSEVRYQTEL